MSSAPSPVRWLATNLIAALLGMVDSAIMTAHHYRIASEGLTKKSFCTISELIDCDTALASSAAYFFGTADFRIPNSELGFLFYLVIGIFSLWALSSASRRTTLFPFMLVIGTAGLLFSIYMAFALYELEVICLFCVVSYLLTLAIFIANLKGAGVALWALPLFPIRYLKEILKPPPGTPSRGHLLQYLIVTVVVYGLGILFFFGLNEKAHAGEPKFNREALLQHFYSQEPFAAALPPRPGWGNPRAPIVIIDFSDFQCPFCKRAAFTLKPFLGPYRDWVRLVFFNFPLDSSCNPNIQRAMHPNACAAAKAVLCAYQKGEAAFWQAHDLIFENQHRLSREFLLKKVGPASGLSPDEMNQCLISSEIEHTLSEDVQLGSEIGVHGTPSIYVNGRYLRGWEIKEVLHTVLEAERERLKDPANFPYPRRRPTEPIPPETPQ